MTKGVDFFFLSPDFYSSIDRLLLARQSSHTILCISNAKEIVCVFEFATYIYIVFSSVGAKFAQIFKRDSCLVYASRTLLSLSLSSLSSCLSPLDDRILQTSVTPPLRRIDSIYFLSLSL